MKAQDLRIGNYISLGPYIYSNWYEVDGEILAEFAKEGCDPYKPIPLTEEWLVKFGFENDYDGCPTLNHKASRFQYSINSKELLYQQTPHNDWSGFPCQYVHQLQNLYFALTGEELPIKE